jgi:catechol 2,3-dioxygenase-like lactoylglutathione lyase family enzyme
MPIRRPLPASAPHGLVRGVCLFALAGVPLLSSAADARAQETSPPQLHHVGLNTVDVERAIAWYLAAWPAARRTTIAGLPAIAADMFLVFHEVDAPPPGAYSETTHRSEPQSAFWHIGAFTNTTEMKDRLAVLGVTHQPLFTGPDDTVGVWRSGLAPYSGMRSAAQIAEVETSPPRDGGFSYVVAPDGVLFEFTGGPDTRDALAHVHFLHEHPQCAATWYVAHLGMELPPVRAADGSTTPRTPYSPCEAELGDAGWPSLERIGTIRTPNASVRHGNGTLSFYPNQCDAARCGRPTPLARSRGQAIDHVAFTVEGLDAWYERLRRAGVTVLEAPHPFGDTRAFMIEDLDGLAIELVERAGAPVPGNASM